MEQKDLRKIAKNLVKNGKGILAIDESPTSIEKKFKENNIENTSDNRLKLRECLLDSKELEKYVSGVILHTETYFQRSKDDIAIFDLLKHKKILVGIKLDQGLEIIDYNDVKIKATKTAKKLEEKIPKELKEGVKDAGARLSKFLKGDKESRTEVQNVEHIEDHGKFIKFSSSENFNEPFLEKVPKGLENLEERLSSGMYSQAQFAKWRCLFTISRCTPTFECVDTNCEILAKYASICQKYMLVPILEPEILCDGDFNVEEHHRVFKYILSLLINKLNALNVDIQATIFKIGFICSGKKQAQIESSKVAEYTNDVLESVLPIKVPGVVFLSGGHSQTDSLHFLQETCQNQKNIDLTFSFGRALTNNALKEWSESKFDVGKTQEVFLEDCMKAVKSSNQQN